MLLHCVVCQECHKEGYRCELTICTGFCVCDGKREVIHCSCAVHVTECIVFLFVGSCISRHAWIMQAMCVLRFRGYSYMPDWNFVKYVAFHATSQAVIPSQSSLAISGEWREIGKGMGQL